MNAHSHTIGSHSHRFTPSGKVPGFTMVPVARYRSESDEVGTTGVTSTLYASHGDFGGGGGSGGRYSKITYSPTFTGTAGTTSATQPSCSSVTTSGSFTGTAGTTSSNGSGTSFSIMPPYIVKYCWERTA